MSTDSERYRRVKDIVMAACEAESDSRASLVETLCEGDAELQAEAMAILNQDVGTLFLEDSAIEWAPETEGEQELVGKIGRISIERLIARGGMGEVYQGVDDLLGRSVAIKVIRPEFRLSEVRKSAFLNEAQILSSLAHPNICQVYDFFVDSEQEVLVMELIEGETLRSVLDSGRKFDALHILSQISDALVEAHERGVVHHDLKPENLILTEGDHVKILDFGLANITQQQSRENASSPIAGTIAYMSPEQVKGLPATTSSDIWSFGKMAVEIFGAVANTKSELPDVLRGQKRQLIVGALAEKPEDRPSAREMRTRIRQIIDAPKKRLIAASSAVGVLLMAIFAWKYFYDLNVEREIAQAAEKQAIAARDEAENLIAFMLTDLREGLVSVGRLNLMESTAREALSYYEGLDVKSLQSGRGQATLAMKQIAEVLDYQGDKEAAIQIAERAISVLEPLHAQQPSDEVVLFRLGWVHYYLSDVYLMTGAIQKSLEHSQAAISLGRQLTQGFKPGQGRDGEPTAEERWKVLLQSLYKRADTLMRSGRARQAVPLLREAAQLAVPAVKKEPKLIPALGDILFKRCDNYFELKLTEPILEACMVMFQQDLEEYKKAPDHHRIRWYFANDHMLLTRVYTLLDRHEEAVDIARKGIEHYDDLLAWEPDNAEVINDYVNQLVVFGRVLSTLGRSVEANQAYAKAEALLKPLLEDNEEATFLNNQFAIDVHFKRWDKARKKAKTLIEMGFTRRIFRENCNAEQIPECSELNGLDDKSPVHSG